MLKSIKRVFCDNVKLTHTGPSKMVNVKNKEETFRYAIASCKVKMKREVIEIIKSNSSSKGDVLRISEVAGILAAKKTSDLIPLCHQINLNTANIKIILPEGNEDFIQIESYVETSYKTGVEMEALVSVSVAALTIYDMCKSADKEIEITEVVLKEKFGGKSGHFINSKYENKI